MSKNGKAPAHLNQQCSSLALWHGVTKTFPPRLHRWPTRSHTPPWTNMFLQERNISSSPASDLRPHPGAQATASSTAAARPTSHDAPRPKDLALSEQFTQFRNLRQSEPPLSQIPVFKTRRGSTPNFVSKNPHCVSLKSHCTPSPRSAINRTWQVLRKPFIPTRS